MSLSQSVQKNMATGSMIRKIFEEGIVLKKQYGEKNVFDLSLGNPIMEPPQVFKEELLKLAMDHIPGMHRYMENAGYLETREAVAAKIETDTGYKFTGQEIVMTCGAAGALNIILKTLLNPGDEVIVFAPYFLDYNSYVGNYGGLLKSISSDENFVPRFNLFESGITPKTKAVIINSPNNPTGVVYSGQTLHQLAEILRKKAAEYCTQIFVVSDDVYSRIVFDGIKCPRMLHHYTNTIVATSFSKDLALPGERIGYAAVHPECDERQDIVKGLIYSNRVLGFVNAPALQQHLVRNIQDVTIPIMEYQKKRDFLYNNLTDMGYQIVKPQGAFYLFPRTPIKDDIAFYQELKKFKVLVVPGSSFGAPGHFRISYCLDDYTLKGCLSGFEEITRIFKKAHAT